jgi:hypothetical protein
MNWNPSGWLLIVASLVIQAAPVRAQAALDSVDRYVRAELARQRCPNAFIPSGARDLARRLPTVAGKIPRSLRFLGMTPRGAGRSISAPTGSHGAAR